MENLSPLQARLEKVSSIDIVFISGSQEFWLTHVVVGDNSERHEADDGEEHLRVGLTVETGNGDEDRQRGK